MTVARTGDESGFASQSRPEPLPRGARSSTRDTGAVLAHELGHNLGLEHVKIAGMLMNEGNAGDTLTKDECDDACDSRSHRGAETGRLSEDEDAKGALRRLEEARKKAEEEESKAREEEERRKAEEDEQRTEELEKIDERLGEIDRRAAELEKKIKEEEDGFRESIEEMKGMSKAQKQQILDDNLPEPGQERKGRAREAQAREGRAGREEGGVAGVAGPCDDCGAAVCRTKSGRAGDIEQFRDTSFSPEQPGSHAVVA